MQISGVGGTGRSSVQDENLVQKRVAPDDAAAPVAQGGVKVSIVSSEVAGDIAPSPAQTKEAVEHINKAMKLLQTSLRFSVDEESGHTIVKVTDSESGEVLRQIPTEATLAIARSLDKVVGVLLDVAA